MKTAGGIIGIIAGVFGVLAALFTIMVGGVGQAFEAESSQLVSLLGWGGLLFSFLVIVFASVALGTRSRWNGALMISASILGAVLGGTLVAVTMLLALIGGVLVLAGSGKLPAAVPVSSLPAAAPDASMPGSGADGVQQAPASQYAEAEPKKSAGKSILIGGGIVVGTIAVLGLGIALFSSMENEEADYAEDMAGQAPVALGEAASVGDVEFTLIGVEVRDYVGGEFFGRQAQPGEIFLAIRYTYLNAGSSPISTWNAPRVQLVDGNGQIYSADIGASSSYATELEQNSNAFSDINPGVSQSDSDVFVLSRDHFQSNQWFVNVSQGRQEALFSLARGDEGQQAADYATDQADETSSDEFLQDAGFAGPEDFISATTIVSPPTSEEVSAIVQVVGVESWDSLNVRLAPGSTSPSVGSIPPGAEGVELIRCSGEATAQQWLTATLAGSKPRGVWCEVYYSFADADVRGWVNASYLDPGQDPADGMCAAPAMVQVGVEYSTARSAVIDAGFFPDDSNDESECDGANVRSWNEYYCMRFPEIESCSGTGAGYCKMVFRNALGEQLVVTTANGPPVLTDGTPNASIEVVSATLECD